MFSLFQNRHPFTILLMAPLAFALGAVHYAFGDPVEQIWNLGFWKSNFQASSFITQLCFIAIVATNAILISILFNRINILDNNIFLSGMLYALFSFSSIDLNDIGILISDFFLILSLIQIAQIKNNLDARSSIFKAALLLGFAATFNLNYLLLLLLPFITLSRIRPFVWREFTLILLAFTVAAAYFGFYSFYYELNFASIIILPTAAEIESWLVIIGLTLLMLSAIISRNKNVSNPGIRIEKIISIWLIGFVLLLLSNFLIYWITQHFNWQNAVFPALYLSYVYSISKTKSLYRFLVYGVLAFGILRFTDLL